MLPITDFLSCTDPLDGFNSQSPHQTQYAKKYVTDLAAASSETVNGMTREVPPSGSDRALNKSITRYDWDEYELNHERLEELQNHGETQWSTDDYIVIDDSVLQRTRKKLYDAGSFYDHSEGEPVWDRISSMPSKLTTKRPIHWRFASLRNMSAKIRRKRRTQSTTSHENSSQKSEKR